MIDTAWAAFIWPPLGLVMGLLLALGSKERSVIQAAMYLFVGMLGASAGGLLTYLFTHQRALLGGFWTSIVTSALGGLVFLGLCKAWIEAGRAPDERYRLPE